MNKFLLITGVSFFIQACSTDMTSSTTASSVPETGQEKSLCLESANNCTFALYSENNDQHNSINSKRAAQRFTPASTFKIANSAIALDSGVVASIRDGLAIDYENYPIQPWWQANWSTGNYNLQTAYANSVLPIYQGIASEVGQTAMAEYLARFDYGNQDISSSVDAFWLNGSLQISAQEQIDFLRSFYHNEFELPEKIHGDVLSIMLAEETPDYKIYAKTGAALVSESEILLWYVGFVENNDGMHYFALNLSEAPAPGVGQKRTDMVMSHLQEAGLI